MAAVLACGNGAVLSHGSAAALWGLLRPMPGPTEVSVPSDGGRKMRDGIRLHRCSSLASAATEPAVELVSRRERIPVTTVPRTIADLRGAVPPRLLRRATRQAEIAGFALGPGVGTDGTRSDLERAFLALCRRHDLPAPEVNVRLGRWTVDFLWRGAGIAVETDSWGFHRGSVAFEDDHARDLDLRRRGFEVRRFTYRQVRDEPAQVAADLRDTLALAS
jgi:very-short-patch-repair endonuclease